MRQKFTATPVGVKRDRRLWYTPERSLTAVSQAPPPPREQALTDG